VFPGTELPHYPPKWERLSDMKVRCVKPYEDSLHSNYWSCNLCVAHVDQNAGYSTVVEHLKSE
jgi:hypothetical protein